MSFHGGLSDVTPSADCGRAYILEDDPAWTPTEATQTHESLRRPAFPASDHSDVYVVYACPNEHQSTGGYRAWSIEVVDRRSAAPQRVLFHVNRTMRIEPLPYDDADAPSLTIEEVRHQHAGVAAVADLRDWLSLSIQAICDAVGLAPSTLYSWQDRPTTRPRASTVRCLLDLWTVAGVVRNRLGEEDAIRWWHSGDPTKLEDLLERGPAALPGLRGQAAALAGADDLPSSPPDRPITVADARDALLGLIAPD